MTALSRAAYLWFADTDLPEGVKVTPIDIESGIAASMRVGVSHYVADAIELTNGSVTALAARWLCGGGSVNALTREETTEADCEKCRLAALVPQRPCVYFAWRGEHLLYVGSTSNAVQRLSSHRTSTPWWPDVTRVTFIECASTWEARQVEAEHIAKRPGEHNREGTVRDARRRSARQVLGGISFGSEPQ